MSAEVFIGIDWGAPGGDSAVEGTYIDGKIVNVRYLKETAMTRPKTDPWFHTAQAGRSYMTPEDVTAAIDEGGTLMEVWQSVLSAIQCQSTEDASTMAFLALGGSPSSPWAKKEAGVWKLESPPHVPGFMEAATRLQHGKYQHLGTFLRAARIPAQAQLELVRLMRDHSDEIVQAERTGRNRALRGGSR